MELWNGITVAQIDSILTVRNERGQRFEMHGRKSYGLTFSSGDGRIVYTMDGRKTESNRTTAVLLPMGADYSLSTLETGDFPLVNFTVTAPIPFEGIAVTRLGDPSGYLRDYERLREAWVVRNDRAKALSILYGIFARLAREEEADHCPALRPAVEYLTAHLSDPALSCETLAAQAGLSTVYFRRLFRTVYGVPPKQYLLELRIRSARQLLAESGRSVTEVAELCGFSSVYHFCRTFRSATGETPSGYRRKEGF